MKKIETLPTLLGLIIIAICLCLSLTSQSAPNCKGTTKKKEPCKSTIVMKDGFCRAHSPATPKCAGVKRDKKPCGMSVNKQGDFCRFHQQKALSFVPTF